MFESPLETQDLLSLSLDQTLFLEKGDNLAGLFSAETEPSLDEIKITEIDPANPLTSSWEQIPDHDLSLSTDPITGFTFDAGNSLTTAQDLGFLTQAQTLTGAVGVTDWNDYYQIYIPNPSSLEITLTGTGGDADLELIQDLNGNGWIEYGEVIDGSYSYTSSEQVRANNLQPGFYYINVEQWSGDTNYNLSIIPGAPIPVPIDLVGNTTITAYDFGLVTTPQVITEYVGNEDWTDYYRFTLETPSSLTAFLDGVTGSASLSLGQDLNGNGWIELTEEIDGSFGSTTLPASVESAYLEPGTYYLQVYTFDNSANYNLNLSTTATTPLPPDAAGNTLSTARPLGGLETPQVITDFIGSGDQLDYYQFDVTVDSTLNLNLDQLTADADVVVIRDINGDGVANYTEVLQASSNSSTLAESLTANLVPGTYYVAVFQYEGDTNYNLSLSTTPTAPLTSNPGTGTPGFDPNFGYGLIDASTAVAAALGEPTGFADVPDLPAAALVSNIPDLNQINVPEVWNQGITGEGVVVAVIDSGVDLNHPDLDSNIWRNSDEIANNGLDDDGNGYVDDIQGYDFEDNDNNPNDIDSHGTHVAGIIAAERDGVDITSTGISYEVSGVAYDAEIMPIRVFSDVGDNYKTIEEQDLALADGIRYAVDNGASVINMSLGLPFWSSAWNNLPQTSAALEYATANNVVTVVAAGNERDLGAAAPSEPAISATESLAIAVGSVDNNGQFTYFSNPAGSFWGAYPYVVAPGLEVVSTIPDNSYTEYGGTSMAAPHVAGVVALMQQANPNLTATEIMDILTQTTNPNGVFV